MPVTNLSVTATVGGAGVVIPLKYDAADLSTAFAQALTNGLVLNPATVPGGTPATTNLVIPTSFALSGVVSASGYDSVIVGNETAPVTLTGGGATAQTIIASDTGLVFTSSGSTNTSLYVGGGVTSVDLSASSGSNAVYVAAGTSTIKAGSGATTIDGGVGPGTIYGGTGENLIVVEGQDTVHLGTGIASVEVGPITGEPDVASAVVYGDTSGANTSIYFQGASANASTVFGGTTSGDFYNLGATGGYFVAGSGGRNTITAGSSSVTVVGAGTFDYIKGSTAGSDSLTAGTATSSSIFTDAAEKAGDTIVGGAGQDVITLQATSDSTPGGPGVNDTVYGGIGTDTIQVNYGSVVHGSTGTLYFVGGSAASTVLGGVGSDTVFTGLGGGYFTAGSTGTSVLIGNGGAATLVGAAGSYLEGNNGVNVADSLVAGAGNETLTAGGGADTLAGSSSGTDVFSFVHDAANQSYTITSFHIGDALYMLNTADVNAALASQTTVGGSLSFTLTSGAKVTLQGYGATLTSASFGHEYS
jgi:hypothetical protein